MLEHAKPLHSGIGGNSVLLTIDGISVFAKKIPLTDLERQPANIMSTANLFELPLLQQYGIGLAGSYSAWRELAAHTMTTNWVLGQECFNFPLLYHWRVIPARLSGQRDREPNSVGEPNITEPNGQQDKEKDWVEFEAAIKGVQDQADSVSFRKRYSAVQNANAHIVLFLEYVPQNLYLWLGIQLKTGPAAAASAIALVEESIKTTSRFTSERGFSHFDAHFKNILTDGRILYFSDFGLALSSNFELSPAEIEFLHKHRNYDRCVGAVNLVHSLITSMFGEDDWLQHLKEYLKGEHENTKVEPSIAATIQKYAPLTVLFMDEFYGKLPGEFASISYPSSRVEHLFAAIDRSEAERHFTRLDVS